MEPAYPSAVDPHLHTGGVLPVAILFAAGLVVGFAVGSWWALVAALGVAIIVGGISELEVDPFFVGVAAGVVTAAGLAAGVLLRRLRR
jgi:hypothetical protein